MLPVDSLARVSFALAAGSACSSKFKALLGVGSLGWEALLVD